MKCGSWIAMAGVMLYGYLAMYAYLDHRVGGLIWQDRVAVILFALTVILAVNCGLVIDAAV